MRVILASDTHYAVSPDAAAFTASVDELLPSEQRPGLLLHGGDVIQFSNDFAAAKAAIDDLAVPYYCTAGPNHDRLPYSSSQYDPYFHTTFAQPSQWYTLRCGNIAFVMLGCFGGVLASGNYGGTQTLDSSFLMCANKVTWLGRELNRLEALQCNVFLLHHIPQPSIVAWSDNWVGCNTERYIYEIGLVNDLIAQHANVAAWLAGHVHCDSNVTRNGKGTVAVSGGIVHALLGNLYHTHGAAYPLGQSNRPNLRYADFVDGDLFVDLRAWDCDEAGGAAAQMTVGAAAVDFYRIPLAYEIAWATPIYEQGWDVASYSEPVYRWWKDDVGLVRDRDGWIESLFDLGAVKKMQRARFYCKGEALDFRHEFWRGTSLGEWSTQSWTPATLGSMPDSRYVKVRTTITATPESPAWVGDMGFRWPKLATAPAAG